ncbi:glyoxylase-like metal-dependent hydrolase (beta-lactamase superfamily II) [Rhodoligotrophos appendicifer]|uniref:MBL fold metallo-hydrolase n=1 Tax=Rhodoligotrophos appendicifer TaxID=987056 RepID=UPI001184F65C|nr:MBL fold metallo-hydrolase [Rhodoligotrophos appendicifer]
MADIPFERDMDFTLGRAQQVSPLIRRLVAPNPGPFTFRGTNTYIVGQGSVAVIDPGPESDDHLAALLAAIEGETVSHIVVTHTHRDHSPLAARLQQATGAPTIAFGPHGSGRAIARDLSGMIELDASGDTDFDPDQRIGHGEVIAGRDWHLEAVFTPGHTSNHMAFALREENALFSADHVMAWSTSIIAPPDGNMADYMASLRHLLERDDEVFWPGHGPEKRDPRSFVRAFITHRQMREQAILDRIRSGNRTIPSIVAEVYKAVDPKLHPAAAMSTWAAVEHLVEQGKVKADGPVALTAEYAPA